MQHRVYRVSKKCISTDRVCVNYDYQYLYDLNMLQYFGDILILVYFLKEEYY